MLLSNNKNILVLPILFSAQTQNGPVRAPLKKINSIAAKTSIHQKLCGPVFEWAKGNTKIIRLVAKRFHHTFSCMYKPMCAQEEEKKKPTDVFPFTGYMWECVHSHKPGRFSRAKISTSEFKDISLGIAIQESKKKI